MNKLNFSQTKPEYRKWGSKYIQIKTEQNIWITVMTFVNTHTRDIELKRFKR